MGNALPLRRADAPVAQGRRVQDVRPTPESPTMYVYLWESGRRIARAVWRLTDEQLARYVAGGQAEIDRRRHLNAARRALGVGTQRRHRDAEMGQGLVAEETALTKREW